ncbi:MAG TPA: ATP-binding cassette domain-containing protein [Methyloceanibacter sp.]|nr:ATP-binding cassette domain-containing protein [Methyloceanibacter sp.]
MLVATDNFIVARNVHLNIPVAGRKRRRSLKANPLAALRDFYWQRRQKELRPLIKGLSFELREGDRLGVIGQNGAGKTTLLRLLAGILVPSSGTLEVNGVTQALLSFSMGMQPEATGLENIYLRGFCHGLSAREIRKRIPEIVEFAQLERVIHDPVRTYSSGMQLRLSFAVATSVKAEILLLDEWISAGDRFFVQRSRERLLGHIDACKILVFASHNLALLGELCTRGIVLKGGKAVFEGDIKDALAFYDSDAYEAAG